MARAPPLKGGGEELSLGVGPDAHPVSVQICIKLGKFMANERYSNVFDAFADTPEEAANLRLRSLLMIKIGGYIESWGLGQKDAAKRLGITQPRLSELLKGKIDKFSLDALVNILDAADLQLDFAVTPKKAA